jgi:hypothetical protein
MSIDVVTSSVNGVAPVDSQVNQKGHQGRDTLKATIGFCIALLVLRIPNAPNIATIIFCVWPFFGLRQAIQAMTMLMLIKSLNPVIYGFEGISALWMWLVLFIASTRIYISIIESRGLRHPVLLVLSLFSIIVVFEAFIFSYYPAVSVFKLLSFSYVVAAILLAFKLTSRRSFNWTPWFVGMWIAVTILSIPTMFIHEIGYYRDSMGFQGILVHPQTMAVFFAPALAWLLGRTVFSEQPAPIALYTIMVIALILIFLSRSRTAIVAIIAAFVVIFLLALIGKVNCRKVLSRRLSHPLVIGLVLIGTVSVLFTSISDIAIDFAMKDSGEVGISDAFEKSRGYIITQSWQNFINNPLFGIGFGVSFSDDFMPVIDSVTGLPLSASTEKGLMPVVILEETGLLGSVFFLPLIFVLIRQALLNRELAMSLMLLTCLFVNIGEMVFFSMGGMGLYLWLLIGWATSSKEKAFGVVKNQMFISKSYNRKPIVD